MKNNSFDNSVKQQLEGHEAPVPADAWANIQKGRKKRRPWVFFWMLAGLLLGGGISLYFLNDQNHQKPGLPVTVHHGNGLNDRDRTLPAGNGVNSNYAIDTNNITPGTTTNNLISKKESPAKKTITNIITAANGPTNTATARSGTDLPTTTSFNNTRPTKDLVKKNDAEMTADTISTGNKVISHVDGKFRATIKAAAAEEEDHPAGDEIVGSRADNPMLDSTEMISSAIKRQDSLSAYLLTLDIKKDTQMQVSKEPGKKMKQTGFSFAFSVSPFATFSNFDKPAFIQRTLETPMSRAEFTATDINIKRETGISFMAMVKKSISAKMQAGAGVSYTVIKEHIKLKGQETTTIFSVVKRLQNGDQLVNDTLSVTSAGLRSIDALNSYHFLSIPLSVQYRISRYRDWELAIQAGLDINLISEYRNAINGKLVSYYGPGNPVPAKNKSMGIGLYTGLYIDRKLGKRYGIFASPYLQFNPSKINLTGMPASGKTGRAGIALGINYHF